MVTNQVYISNPEINRNNLVHWVRKGYLIRLRQSYYAFPEYRESTDFTLYFADIILKSYMQDDFNTDRLMEFSYRIGSKTLNNRIDMLKKVHNL